MLSSLSHSLTLPLSHSLTSKRVKPSRREGFTLVEMITVVMIIAILMAATTTAISGARKTAKRTHSLQTVRQLAAAWTAYATDQGKFPDKKNFSNGKSGDVFAASPKNIGGLLNTQYQRKNGKTDYTKPRSDSVTYFSITREECEPSKANPKLEDWPELDFGKSSDKNKGKRGIRDKFDNVVYFALDFDLDGKTENPITGKNVSASALSYSSAQFSPDEKDQRKLKKFLVAY